MAFEGQSTSEAAGQPVSFQARPAVYLPLVLALSWIFWIPAALWGQPEPDAFTLVLHYLGGAVPAVAALSLARFAHGADFWQDYLQRIVQAGRISTRWWAVILLLVPGVTGLAAGIDRLAGGPGWALEQGLGWGVLSTALFLFLFGPLPEEIGWRGYALDGLQRRCGPLAASLILGAVWATWHLPLFFIEGSFQAGRLEAYYLILLYTSVVAQTVVITFVYNHTRRSTLSAVMMHFMTNWVGEMVALSRAGELYMTAAWVFVAVMISLSWSRSGEMGDLSKRLVRPL